MVVGNYTPRGAQSWTPEEQEWEAPGISPIGLISICLLIQDDYLLSSFFKAKWRVLKLKQLRSSHQRTALRLRSSGMAGIGEAGAIINVAQIGISLSNTLIAYIGEVRDAPSRIHRIGNEVLTTSERLKDIGELVEKNSQSRILSEESIKSAVRCSSECHKIIEDVKTILCKSGWQGQSRALDEDEIDISLFSTLRWPFLKVKLEVPRVELQRIKIDLSLIFTSAMVFTASSVAEQQKFKQSIPRLARTKQWATKRSEEVKQRAMEASRDPSLWAREGQSVDDDSDIIEEFVSFQQQRYEEEENRKAKERAALLRAEEEERTRLKEEAEREVERRAVEQYKQEQERLRTLTAEKKDTFRSELSKVGLHDDQIQVVLDSPNLDFSGASESTNTSNVRLLMRGPTPNGSVTSEDLTSFEKDGNVSITPRGSRRKLSRWRSKKPVADNSSERSLNILSESSNVSSTFLEYETWLLDVSSSQRVELLPSNEWLDAKLNNPRKDHDVWHCFASLKPAWRTAVLEFIKLRSQNPNPTWSLYHIEVPQRWSRTSLFGHKRDENLVQLILCRRKDPLEENGNLKGKPRTGGLVSNLSKKVSFATGHGGESNHHGDIAASNNTARPRIEQEVGERINRLEAKRSTLGPDDQERIGEIDDMINLLRDQEKLEKSLSEARNNVTSHDTTDPKRITRSESTSAPPIRDDVTANNSVPHPGSYSRTRPPRSLPLPNPRHVPKDLLPSSAHTNTYGMSDDDEVIYIRDDSERQPGKSVSTRRYSRRTFDSDDSDSNADMVSVTRARPESYFERDSERDILKRRHSSRHSSARLPVRRPSYRSDKRERSFERTRPRFSSPDYGMREVFSKKQRTFTEDGSLLEDDNQSKDLSVAARQREERQNSKSRGRSYSPSPSFKSHGTEKSAYGDQPTTSTIGRHGALVPRAGGRRLLRDYLQDQIMEKSIRVQGGSREMLSERGYVEGDDSEREIVYSIRDKGPRVRFEREEYVSRPPNLMRETDRKHNTSRSGSKSAHSHRRHLSRRDSYRATDGKSPPRTDALDKRREAETSEDDDYTLDIVRVGSEKLDSESEPSDAEVIDRTLRRLTTFGGDTLPAIGMSAPLLSNVDDEWASSAMPNGLAGLNIETDSAPGNPLGPTSIVPGTPSNPRATRLLQLDDATQRIATDDSGEDIGELGFTEEGDHLKTNGISRQSTVEDPDCE